MPPKFEKETTQLLKNEIERLRQECNHLKEFKFKSHKFPNVEFVFNPIFSMIDGKATNSLMDNSAAVRCPFCRAKPTDIMRDNTENFEVDDTDKFCHGLSTLHFGPRAFENICKMGFNQVSIIKNIFHFLK